MTICNFLLLNRNQHRVLQQIVAGDEKWLLYFDHTHNRQWVNLEDLPEPAPRNGLHPKKVMLSICWEFQGIIQYELLPRNAMINAKLYWQQLGNLKAALQVNRPEKRKVRLLDDNARAHTAIATRQKLEELGW